LDWKKAAYEFGNDIETKLDFYKLKLRENMGWTLPVQICPFITYGNSENIYLRGRLIYDRSIVTADNDTLFENLVNMYKRMASIEIAGAELRVSFSNTEFTFTTDEDGYFEFPLKLKTPLPKEQQWHNPVLELIECPVAFQKRLFKHGLVMTPPVTAQFGVISDVDDTILPTNAESLWKMAVATFTKNQYSRFPFPGVPEFYNALHKGISGENFNPFFYVSSSPWNLYDLLVDFFKINKIPPGPLLLKDYGFTHNKLFSESHLVHKSKMIRNILNHYPDLPFILIGDSGQKDPEIYTAIAREYPGRIATIYIRDVSSDSRDTEINQISELLKINKVEMIRCEHSLAAAKDAASKGFIRKSDVELISLH
jgi:phosphatidate phosphatase APP1